MTDNYQSYTTYQAPDVAPAPAWNPVRVHDTMNRVSSTDGTVTETVQSTDRGNTGELNPYHGTGSLFATARNANGSPVTEILGSTLVEIGGIQAPVTFFVSEGILQKNPDGTFSETTDKPGVTPEVDTSDHQPLSAGSMADVNAALDTVDQGSLDALAAVGTGVAIGTLDHAALVNKFQQASGLGIEDASARVGTITAAYKAQSDSALVSRCGLSAADLPAFYAWCRDTQRGALQETVQRQIHAHDVSGWANLANQWQSAIPPSIAALKAAGVPMRAQGQATQIFVRGSWMTPGAAAKAGLI